MPGQRQGLSDFLNRRKCSNALPSTIGQLIIRQRWFFRPCVTGRFTTRTRRTAHLRKARIMLHALVLSAVYSFSAVPDEFIVLSEFQVWADPAGPEVFKELNRRYLKTGRSHVFGLYPRHDYFVWQLPKTRGWVDEAIILGAFNVFCIGDDIRTADGFLFDERGPNPRFKDVLFGTIAYAHEKGLMVAVEPQGLPSIKDDEHLQRWFRSWLGPDVPRDQRTDIVKLSLDWFGASQFNPQLAEEIETVFTACRSVNPDVLIYLDSVHGIWRTPTPFHRWFLQRFPRTIISHYLNTDQIDAFREVGASNMMVQINPSEIEEVGGQFFIFHDKTVAWLQDAVRRRVRYLSLAGVNYGYSRYNYDLFLDVIRPHLALKRNLQAVRETLVADRIAEPTTKEDVRAWLLEQANKGK